MANQLYGQSNNQQGNPAAAVTAALTIKQLLPERLGENWRAISAARSLSVEESTILPDADIHAEYQLLARAHRDYAAGKNKATVEIFAMRFASGAYGLFTFNRSSNAPHQQEFYKGRYLVRITSDIPVDNLLIEALKQIIPGDAGELPVLPSHLPEQNKIAETEKYLVGPAAIARLAKFTGLEQAINFSGGAEAVTADYQNGSGSMSLLIVEYHTPQLATDSYARFQQHFDGLNQLEKDQRILRRIGNYVVEAVNVQDRAAAENVIGQIKYTPKVYWEGRKMRDIPLESRPPDPAAIEEAKRTAQVIIRALYWIGIILLGAIALGVATGGAYFYWRRHRRRRLGLDDLFSDAGGTVTLNLDDYLLSPGEPTVKQIEKGNSD